MNDPSTPSFKKSKTVAALLSLLYPGFGQLYAGRALRGAAFFLSFWAVTALLFGGVLGRSFGSLALALALLLVIDLAAVVDAALVANSRVRSNAFWQRWYFLLPLGILLSVSLRWTIVAHRRLQTYVIPAQSMEPTLRVGDHLVASREDYGARLPARNELVVFKFPDDPHRDFIKRVVALPGDTVEIRDKVLYLDGRQVPERWVVHVDPSLASAAAGPAMAARDQMAPLMVPPGHVFVLGDNRDNSYDSRFFGPVAVASLKAKPLYVYWSPIGGRTGHRFGPP